MERRSGAARMPTVSMQNDAIDQGGLDEERDPTKVLFRRYLAYLVDFLVILLIAVLALAFTGESNTPEELNADADQVKRYEQHDNGTYHVFFRDVPVLEDEVGILVVEEKDLQKVFLAAAAAWVLLYVGLQGFTGATVGKGAAGIRTVKKDGDPPGILRALVRSILLPIDSLPSAPFLPLVGTIFAVATTGNKRLGDLLGGTYVVDKDARGRPVFASGSGAPGYADEPLPMQQPLPQPLAEDPLQPAAAPFAAAPGPDPAAPAWAQPATAAPPTGDVDWTAEQPSPLAGTDPWAPAAGAGTAASDWERVIAEEQAQQGTDEPAAAADAATPAGDGLSIDDYEPQWDEGRNAYIQWDPRRDEWLQFSDELQQWHPIDRPPT
jgi:uncharacterized RDD family membrane protein YckC